MEKDQGKSWPDQEIDRLRAENAELRAELADERRTPNQKVLDALIKVRDMKAELTAERKKREEAEAGLAEFTVMQQCLRESEAQVEVLRKGLQYIIDDHCGVSNCSCCDADVESAQETLANLPARAEKVKAVMG